MRRSAESTINRSENIQAAARLAVESGAEFARPSLSLLGGEYQQSLRLCSRHSRSKTVGLGDTIFLSKVRMNTNRLTTPTGALAILVVLPIVLAAGWQQLPHAADVPPASTPALPPNSRPTAPVPEDRLGFIYGRVTTNDGHAYVGSLRWGGGEEAFWSEYFNGVKNENVWASHVSPERLKQRRPVALLGFQLGTRERSFDLDRPFTARFGDIVRIDTKRSTFQVTLKSGSVHELDRFASDDLADGVRVWDASRGVVDIDEWAIRSVEFLPANRTGGALHRLHATVQTRQGDFTGFIQWNREKGVGGDMLTGYHADAEVSLPFDRIRSVERSGVEDALVIMTDDREIMLSGARETGERGIYVNDLRYGRVLVSWESFERIDFSSEGTGPAYEDFPRGLPLTGSVTLLSGRSLSGRLVFDLDESETTETLDAPFQAIDYSIPLGLIASIVPARRETKWPQLAQVTLHSGEVLNLEASGDLSDANAGSLIFIGRGTRAEYVGWSEIERIDLDRPALMYPPVSGR